MERNSLQPADQRQLDERPAEDREQQQPGEQCHRRERDREARRSQARLRHQPGDQPALLGVVAGSRRTAGHDEDRVAPVGDDHVEGVGGARHRGGRKTGLRCLAGRVLPALQEVGQAGELERAVAALEQHASTGGHQQDALEEILPGVGSQQPLERSVERDLDAIVVLAGRRGGPHPPHPGRVAQGGHQHRVAVQRRQVGHQREDRRRSARQLEVVFHSARSLAEQAGISRVRQGAERAKDDGDALELLFQLMGDHRELTEIAVGEVVGLALHVDPVVGHHRGGGDEHECERHLQCLEIAGRADRAGTGCSSRGIL